MVKIMYGILFWMANIGLFAAEGGDHAFCFCDEEIETFTQEYPSNLYHEEGWNTVFTLKISDSEVAKVSGFWLEKERENSTQAWGKVKERRADDGTTKYVKIKSGSNLSVSDGWYRYINIEKFSQIRHLPNFGLMYEIPHQPTWILDWGRADSRNWSRP